MKTLRNILIAFLIIFVILSLLPYLFPIKSYESNDKKPFANSEFINVDGMNIHYQQWSKLPEGKSTYAGKFVLVHGFFGSTYSWDKVAQDIADKGFYVVALDLPGYGYSTKETGIDHSLTANANLVWNFINKMDEVNSLDLDTPWNLVGHSMGGAVAAKVAETRTNIGVLILVDPAINNAGFNNWRLGTWYPPTKRWISVFTNYYYFQYSQISNFLESAYGRRASDEEIRGYLDPLQEPGTSLSAADIVATQNETVDLSKIKVATEIIYGEKDSWVSSGEIDRINSDLQFSLLYTIPDAGHIPQETHPEEFKKLIFDFVDVPSSATSGLAMK